VACFTRERVDALTCANVPNFSRVVKRRSKKLVAVRIEVQAYNFGLMAGQVKDLLACLDIPQLCSVIHRASCHEHAMRVERETHDFHLVALERMITLTCVRIPNLRFLVKRTSHYFVAIHRTEKTNKHPLRYIHMNNMLERVKPNLAYFLRAIRVTLTKES